MVGSAASFAIIYCEKWRRGKYVALGAFLPFGASFFVFQDQVSVVLREIY